MYVLCMYVCVILWDWLDDCNLLLNLYFVGEEERDKKKKQQKKKKEQIT